MFIPSLIYKFSNTPLWKEQVKVRTGLRDLNLKFWLQYNLFSSVWWLLLIIFIATWYIWWKLVNKTRLLEIVAYGLLVSNVSSVLDLIGTEFCLWGYPNMIFPLMPPLFSVDLCALPVAYMLIYQYFTSYKSFTIAITIIAFIFAFIGEPIAVRLDIYQMNSWKHMYSFPLYIILALLLKWLMNKIQANQKKLSYKLERNLLQQPYWVVLPIPLSQPK